MFCAPVYFAHLMNSDIRQKYILYTFSKYKRWGPDIQNNGHTDDQIFLCSIGQRKVVIFFYGTETVSRNEISLNSATTKSQILLLNMKLNRP